MCEVHLVQPFTTAAMFLHAVGRAVARSEARHDSRCPCVDCVGQVTPRDPPSPGPQVATLYTHSATGWTRSPLDAADLADCRARRVPVYSTMHEFDAHLPGKYPRGAVVLDGVGAR